MNWHSELRQKVNLSSYQLKIKRELVQRKPTKSRQSFSVDQGALQAAIQPVLFSVVLFFELALQCCQSPAVQRDFLNRYGCSPSVVFWLYELHHRKNSGAFCWMFSLLASILEPLIGITRQQLSLNQNWSWKKRRKRTTPKACRSVFDERRSQRLFTFCGSPHACFVKLLEVCHELRSSAFLLPYFLWLFW